MKAEAGLMSPRLRHMSDPLRLSSSTETPLQKIMGLPLEQGLSREAEGKTM
jgi:hypothetical protein